MSSSEYPDHFSSGAENYSAYRPTYPYGLFRYLSSISPGHETAWDCATGSGQAAAGLKDFFHRVMATDASTGQIGYARIYRTVMYRAAYAEQAPLKDSSVDLITVAQALHWFNLESFYSEAGRVLKEQGILAVWSYNLLLISAEIDSVIKKLYHEFLDGYWPPERRFVEEGYKDMPFPFREVHAPVFHMSESWSLKNLTGYLTTWSAVKRYRECRRQDPLDLIIQELTQRWGDRDSRKKVT